MGKKAATKRGSASPGGSAVADEHEAARSEVKKLKEEGNRHFGRKEHQKALDAYDRALKACAAAGEAAQAEAPLLHSNKAACFLSLQRMKEAINECTSALAVEPGFTKALVYRSKAHEAMGHYKQALSDIQKANKADSVNTDTQEAEKRLKDLVSGKARANGTVAANGNGVKKAPPKGGRQQQMLVFPVKVTLGGETRLMHVVGHTTYAELLEQVQLKFPSAGPCAVKYLDREGDLVTITNKHDLGAALEEVFRSAEKLAAGGGAGRQGVQAVLPPLRLQLVPVGSAADVPEPPQDELAQLRARRILLQQQQAAMGQAPKQEEKAEPQQGEMYELEQWIVDFAGLFRDQLGIEPDRHIDLTNVAWDKMQAALDSAVLSDQAPKLFGQAADRFQEVTAHGLLQWGNVHLCEGKRVIDKAAAEGRDLADVAGEAEALFAKAENRFLESMRIKPDFYDGAASIANLHFERGKLAAGFAIVPAKPDQPADKQVDEAPAAADAPKDAKAAEEARAAAANALSQRQLAAALGKLTGERLARGEPHFKAAWAKFQEAVDMLPAEEQNKPLKPQPEGAPQTAEQEEGNVWAHCQVMWGNLLYELSQMRGAVGGDWRADLDAATAKFRAAGCPERDVWQALKAHTQAAHIELGPEPQAEQPKQEAAAAASAGKAEEEKVKGLPSLGPKPKKKAAAESA